MEILKAEPLQFYDTLICLSAGEDNSNDCVLFGNEELIITHLAAMMLRHEAIRNIVLAAMQRVVCSAIDEQEQAEKN